MRRTGNISALPAIGSIGRATSKTVREPELALPVAAHPVHAPVPTATVVASRFLRSTIVSSGRMWVRARIVHTSARMWRRRLAGRVRAQAQDWLLRRATCYSGPHVFAQPLFCDLLVLAPLGGRRGKRI